MVLIWARPTRMGELDRQIAGAAPDCNHQAAMLLGQKTPELILASASPRRRELLGRIGLPFTVVPAEVTEHEAPDSDPRAMVRHNAALKADWVAARHPAATVIGADTTVFIDRTVLNKPRDATEARAMLRRLS